jgi:hypothetical protein
MTASFDSTVLSLSHHSVVADAAAKSDPLVVDALEAEAPAPGTNVPLVVDAVATDVAA